MIQSEDNTRKNLLNLLSVIKLFTLLFSLIVVINGKNTSPLRGKNNSLPIITVVLFIIIYCLWYLFSIKSQVSKHYKNYIIIENILFSVTTFCMIFLSDTYDSQYKVIFIFVIMLSTLQLGMKYGVLSASIISVLILAIDLIFAPPSLVNEYFQKDLVFAGVFITTAWALGYYAQLESERLEIKDIHLKRLNEELKVQDKRRRDFEEILFKNENCYNLLLEHSRDIVLVHRTDEILFANESAVKLLGLSSLKDLNNMTILQLISDEHKSALANMLNDFDMKGGQIISFEEKLQIAGGNTLTVINTSTGFIYDGHPTILSILHDITSNKEAERLQLDVEKNKELLNESLEYNKMITEFFSNISHELRTPLNLIYSAIQVLTLNEGHVPLAAEKLRRYYGIINQNCFRLMRLINNLLDLSRLDSGFLKLNATNHDIISVVEDISLSVVPYMESKGISLIFDTDVEEKVMSFDPDKLERIVLNLLSNAYKFTNSNGHIFVNINDLGSHIVISVKDTGIGIPPDKQNIIFERFGQVNKTLSRFHEGSGIGLSLVKSFVELHGGTITVTSDTDKGSEFKITLPVIINDNDDAEDYTSDKYSSNIERSTIEFSDIYS